MRLMKLENILKGRMAETLVEELLRQSGNAVYRFGYEAIVQNLAQLNECFDRYCEVGEKIRAIPDFIVVDRKGEPDFVEVKFRWKPEVKYEKDYKILEKIGKFWAAKIIFVNCWEQPYLRISEPPYMDKNKNLNQKPLLEKNNWRIDKKLYTECEELVYKYLTPTLIPKKLAK